MSGDERDSGATTRTFDVKNVDENRRGRRRNWNGETL
eukprot:CAMPEP_0172519618 /NCGR_PEP_ID=MMETSP1066-20121228/291524_1 /TAXON_ID=671091 /ORGANISM="Coscinodiscus wailesii, Strain CCMP2513" /LENGTH=36 /DNA_ID= /DNA_START= /DNA_END= /DNA_ORIENTATION=